MDKSTFLKFVEKRDAKTNEIYKEMFEGRETNNPIDIAMLQTRAFAKANDEMLFEILTKKKQ
ncbi:hypothetical protein BMJ13_08110 [Staphylococcus saprophyticus]|uniref:hypothetical protein n=1 Tax=Staphylococcus saprophyticus TaxID=29385 RepID=UPI00094B947D|nr:hypothetical protein [Staphylococcus saprophyticus]OLN92947.1 hypothetical protein BMJ13_08110 [Staphylococcus saprophyticus]